MAKNTGCQPFAKGILTITEGAATPYEGGTLTPCEGGETSFERDGMYLGKGCEGVVECLLSSV
jgi:hypothetical protein